MSLDLNNCPPKATFSSSQVEKRMCSRYMHMASMRYASTVKRLLYQKISLKAYNSALGTSSCFMIWMPQDCVKHRDRWNYWHNIMYYTWSCLFKELRVKKTSLTSLPWGGRNMNYNLCLRINFLNYTHKQ